MVVPTTAPKARQVLPSPEENADLPSYAISPVDCKLLEVYGDFVHANPGTHITGEVPIHINRIWQSRWKRLTALPQCHYMLPQGPVSHDFITQLTVELQGVCERKWNSERPLVFLMVVLTQMDSKLRFSKVRAHIKHCLKTWNMGNYQGQVDDTDHTCWQFITYGDRQALTDDSKARSFNGLVQSGCLHQVVHRLTSRDEGGVLHPDSLDTKTGRKGSDVLADKNPDGHQPPIKALKDYTKAPEPLQLQVGYESFESTARKLSGSAGPSGIDAIDLQHWMFRFRAVSKNLLNKLILWTEWLVNAPPSWSAYRAMMACCLIAIDKQPVV